LIILYLYSSGIGQSEWTSKLAQTIPELCGNGTLIPSCFVHGHGTRHSLVGSWQKVGKGTGLQSLTPANHPHAIHMPSIRMIQMSSSRLLLHHLDDTNYRQREANTPAAPCSFRPWREAGFGLRNWWSSSQRCLKMKNGWKMVETTNHPGTAQMT
jgi:hypothetical protein